ncbi:putative nuclease HARBI1 isoform X1 [Scylla paramamosain]|uniref:putative nuclease HARBI1 isoform X1 n=1 Tax=Scylla paramamosain TaxID=85552 RepID=UPI0030832B1C
MALPKRHWRHCRTYASKCQQGLQVCVCTVLSDKSVQEIKMPPTHLDQRRTAHQFFRIKNFLRVIGAIDGSHIAMKGQSVDEALYLNWKRYHSL